jgi:hypothetical protein
MARHERCTLLPGRIYHNALIACTVIHVMQINLDKLLYPKGNSLSTDFLRTFDIGEHLAHQRTVTYSTSVTVLQV